MSEEQVEQEPVRLTQDEISVLSYLIQYYQTHMHSPDYRSIATHIGRTSTNAVTMIVNKLYHKGYVMREYRRPRTLKPIKNIDGTEFHFKIGDSVIPYSIEVLIRKIDMFLAELDTPQSERLRKEIAEKFPQTT